MQVYAKREQIMGGNEVKSLLKIQEAAELMNVSPWTIRKWIRDKKLDVVRLGRALRVPAGAIEQKIANGLRKAD